MSFRRSELFTGRPISDPARKLLGNGEGRYYKRDFWAVENAKFAEPHFRMHKVARLVRQITRERECDLLDVGCGPAALARLMPPNVRYYGVDIAIPEPAPNLIEMDFLEQPIGFRAMKFDIVVVQGVFEYMGEFQSRKFADIAGLLRADGKAIITYQNFRHRRREVYWSYSNTQLPEEFKRNLSRFFKIERCFPGSHNWRHSMPGRRFMKISQAHLNVNVPIISPLLAVDYFYICSPCLSQGIS